MVVGAESKLKQRIDGLIKELEDRIGRAIANAPCRNRQKWTAPATRQRRLLKGLRQTRRDSIPFLACIRAIDY